VSLTCADGPPSILTFNETEVCKYYVDIQVPLSVCATSCCTPAVFSKKVVVGSTIGIVQQNATAGEFYDASNPEAISLCTKYYKRCFVFNSTFCAGSEYVPLPPDCVGGSGWELLGELPLVGSAPIQSVWGSDGINVVTIPLAEGCVTAGGTARPLSLDFSTKIDLDLMEVPDICLKMAL